MIGVVRDGELLRLLIDRPLSRANLDEARSALRHSLAAHTAGPIAFELGPQAEADGATLLLLQDVVLDLREPPTAGPPAPPTLPR